MGFAVSSSGTVFRGQRPMLRCGVPVGVEAMITSRECRGRAAESADGGTRTKCASYPDRHGANLGEARDPNRAFTNDCRSRSNGLPVHRCPVTVGEDVQPRTAAGLHRQTTVGILPAAVALVFQAVPAER